MSNGFGVITEQGDLGLGFTPVTESQREDIEKVQKENLNNGSETNADKK